MLDLVLHAPQINELILMSLLLSKAIVHHFLFRNQISFIPKILIIHFNSFQST